MAIFQGGVIRGKRAQIETERQINQEKNTYALAIWGGGSQALELLIRRLQIQGSDLYPISGRLP